MVDAVRFLSSGYRVNKKARGFSRRRRIEHALPLPIEGEYFTVFGQLPILEWREATAWPVVKISHRGNRIIARVDNKEVPPRKPGKFDIVYPPPFAVYFAWRFPPLNAGKYELEFILNDCEETVDEDGNREYKPKPSAVSSIVLPFQVRPNNAE